MRSIIPFEIEYDKKDNTLSLIQSEDVTYIYYLKMRSERTTKGAMHFYTVTSDKVWGVNFSNWEYLDIMPEGLTIRSIEHYA